MDICLYSAYIHIICMGSPSFFKFSICYSIQCCWNCCHSRDTVGQWLYSMCVCVFFLVAMWQMTHALKSILTWIPCNNIITLCSLITRGAENCTIFVAHTLYIQQKFSYLHKNNNCDEEKLNYNISMHLVELGDNSGNNNAKAEPKKKIMRWSVTIVT